MNHVGSSVNLYVVRDGKILLMRRISQRWMDGKLQIPGGHVEPGESPLVAVLREAQEELGIKISSNDVTHVATLAVKDKNGEYFALQFQLTTPDRFTFQITEPHKCSELVWADIHNLPDDTIAIFKSAIKQSLLEHQSYVEVGY